MTIETDAEGRTVSYQRQFRRCGRQNCRTCSVGPGHGPYWYAYWREKGRVRSRYIGLQEPVERTRVEFRVQTLGRLSVRRTDGTMPDLTGRGRELFTMLLSAPYGSIGREEIAESLWPEFDPVAADRNVRVTVAALRRYLGDSAYVRVSGPSAILALPAGCRDDQMFEAAARDAVAFGRPEAIARALALHSGLYLPEDVYSDWTTYRRDILWDLYRDLALRAASESSIAEIDRAAWLRTVLSRDGADEAAAEALMRLLAEANRRPEALRVFRSVEAALRNDLGVRPGAGLLALNDRVRAG